MINLSGLCHWFTIGFLYTGGNTEGAYSSGYESLQTANLSPYSNIDQSSGLPHDVGGM